MFGKIENDILVQKHEKEPLGGDDKFIKVPAKAEVGDYYIDGKFLRPPFGKIEDGVLVQKQPNYLEGFVAVPDDAVCGQIFKDKKFINPEQEPPSWDEIKDQRNALLSDSDWTQLNDAPLSEEDKEKWKQYRQALRDLPQDYPETSKLTWPETIEDK